MSDGPHRSLPMRRAWKKVAEWADNANFDRIEVAERLFQAIVKDFQKDIPPETIALLKSQFNEMESFLFPAYLVQSLEDSRQNIVCSSLCHLLIDCASYEISLGHLGEQGLMDAFGSSIRDWMQRMSRQVEEHYHRAPNLTEERATNVSVRIQEAIQQVSIVELTQQILGHVNARPSHSSQRTGLEDGVPTL